MISHIRLTPLEVMFLQQSLQLAVCKGTAQHAVRCMVMYFVCMRLAVHGILMRWRIPADGCFEVPKLPGRAGNDEAVWYVCSRFCSCCCGEP